MLEGNPCHSRAWDVNTSFHQIWSLPENWKVAISIWRWSSTSPMCSKIRTICFSQSLASNRSGSPENMGERCFSNSLITNRTLGSIDAKGTVGWGFWTTGATGGGGSISFHVARVAWVNFLIALAISWTNWAPPGTLPNHHREQRKKKKPPLYGHQC